jgi:AraC-like DNA-binding protein
VRFILQARVNHSAAGRSNKPGADRRAVDPARPAPGEPPRTGQPGPTSAANDAAPFTAGMSSALPPGTAASRPVPAGVRPVRFHRSVALLRLIVSALEEYVTVQLLERDLQASQRRLRGLELEDQRLHEELHRRLPQLAAGTSVTNTPGSQARTLVHCMLHYVQEHYNQPMTLDELAASLGRNPSYLSTLFARATGLNFHHYLNELRLAKAKELLSDPLRTVSEVACSVGYASEDWFRHAFKKNTGVPPREWRKAGR